MPAGLPPCLLESYGRQAEGFGPQGGRPLGPPLHLPLAGSVILIPQPREENLCCSSGELMNNLRFVMCDWAFQSPITNRQSQMILPITRSAVRASVPGPPWFR